MLSGRMLVGHLALPWEGFPAPYTWHYATTYRFLVLPFEFLHPVGVIFAVVVPLLHLDLSLSFVFAFSLCNYL